jgi:hypothetical protein
MEYVYKSWRDKIINRGMIRKLLALVVLLL